ncbi:MAG: hypothetical protein CMC36_01615 [Flavobacteriaceae bacterium]|nr:hypothetical protein [Flavobacteriaceae bacterium]|tara:strand:- start:12502 stop:13476 length:975 start_codon:yes stop_codon:yes gene_type:complete
MKNNFKENEELDIIVLIEKIKLMLLSVFLQIFRRSKNFLSAWKQLLGVILVGVLLGYFQTDHDKPLSKEATLLVKINFDAGNFVYDAVDLINSKALINDNKFFYEELSFDTDESIDEITIIPIIDIKDIVEKNIKANEINVLFDNLEYEDGFSVTEGFKSDYDYHFISLSVSNNSSIKTINKVIYYLNNNPLFKELEVRNKQRIISLIYENEETIEQINKILDQNSNKTKGVSHELYIDNKEVDFNEIIRTKIFLQNKNEALRDENLVTKKTVMTINKSDVLIENNSFFENKMILYPILFLLFYAAITIVVAIYFYLDKLDRAS